MKDDLFVENRCEREEIGVLYRLLQKRYGDIAQIMLLDPRNTLSIIGYFFRQVKARRIPLKTGLAHLLFHQERGAIFINGHYISEKDRTGADLFRLVDHLFR